MRNSLGEWEHSELFTEAHTAKEWGMTPAQFRALPITDQAEMIAHDRAWVDMTNYNAQLSAEASEDLQKKMKRRR